MSGVAARRTFAYLAANQCLIIRDATIIGRSGYTLIWAGTNSKFTMYSGILRGNTGDSMVGGVHVASSSVFNMLGGTITGGSASWGGAVYVAGGTFYMSGAAVIDSNTVSSGALGGGGVYIYSSGTFYMQVGNSLSQMRDGVYVSGNEFFVKSGNSILYGKTNIGNQTIIRLPQHHACLNAYADMP